MGKVLRRILLLAVVLGWAAVILTITVSSLPYNPATIRVTKERDLKALMPEGWGFFTRNPREPDLIVLTAKGQRWKRLPNMPISSAANLFGIDRFPRAQSVELGMLLTQIDEEAWKPCDGAVGDCLEKAQIVQVRDASPVPTLRGTLALVRQEPVPWAWSEHRAEITMPSTVVVVNIHDIPTNRSMD